MFKKPFRTQSQNPLKRSEIRKLKQNLQKRYPLLQDRNILDSIIPHKEEVTIMRVMTHNGHNVIVYLVQKVPVFFDADPRNVNLLPTVYILWRFPFLCETFCTQVHVFKFLFRGADFMLPGIVKPSNGELDTWEKGSPRCIILEGSNARVAIGNTTGSTQQAEKQNWRGKGVYIHHVYKDYLWRVGPKTDPPYVDDPNYERKEDSQDAAKVAEEAEAEDEGESQSTQKESDKKETDEGQEEGEKGEGIEDGEDDEDGSKEAEEQKEEKEEEEVVKQPSTPQEMDRCIEAALVKLIQLKIVDNDLPMQSSTFYTNHVLNYREPNIQLDIKKSTYKKVNRFLQIMGKKGVITTKNGPKGQLSVTKVHGDNKFVTDFAENLKQEKEQETRKRKEEARRQAVEDSVAEDTSKPIITEFFRPPVSLHALFEKFGDKEELKHQLFSLKEVKDALWGYVVRNSLVTPDKRGVILDQVLLSALFNKKKSLNDAVVKKEALEKYMLRLQKFHEVNRGPISEIRKGEVEHIVIQLENRQGGRKHVVRVTGLESFAITPKEMSSGFSKHFAASCSVQNTPGGKGQTVVIQGNVMKEVETHLVKQYRVPRKYIELQEPKPKKKKAPGLPKKR